MMMMMMMMTFNVMLGIWFSSISSAAFWLRWWSSTPSTDTSTSSSGESCEPSAFQMRSSNRNLRRPESTWERSQTWRSASSWSWSASASAGSRFTSWTASPCLLVSSAPRLLWSQSFWATQTQPSIPSCTRWPIRGFCRHWRGRSASDQGRPSESNPVASKCSLSQLSVQSRQQWHRNNHEITLRNSWWFQMSHRETRMVSLRSKEHGWPLEVP